MERIIPKNHSLIKFHQYLCEENNAKFKEVFRLCKVPTVYLKPEGKPAEPQRLDKRCFHINNIMGSMRLGKEELHSHQKRIHVSNSRSLFDFLNECMTGY